MKDIKLGHIVCSIVCKNGKNHEVIYCQFEIIFVFFSSVGKNENLKTDFDLRNLFRMTSIKPSLQQVSATVCHGAH
jgi:hypothetical protein